MFQITISPEEIKNLPLAAFEGEIEVIDAEDGRFEEAVSYLEKQKVLGFDTETRPSFTSDRPSSGTALLQLSTADRAFLFRLKKIGLPASLAHILSRGSILKVGAATQDDVRGLQKITHFQPNGFVDLQGMVWEYGIRDRSVKRMAAIILGVKISKAQQLSNWEAQQLSASQCRYAATDAWVCREMYRVLQESPKAPLTPEQLYPERYNKQNG